MRTTLKPPRLPGKLLLSTLLGVFLFLPGLRGQHNLALYQMQSLPQSFELNPGRLPKVKGYLQLPGLSGIGVGVGNNSFGLEELGLKISDFDPGISLDTLLAKANDDNRLGLDGSVQLFGLGFSAANGKVFIGLGVRERIEARGSLPRSVFVLSDDISRENFVPGKVYDFSNLDFSLLHYRSIGLGVGIKITSRLSAGARFNYLMGQENLWTVNNGFRLNAVGDRSVFNIDGGFDVYSAGLIRLADGPDISQLLGSGNSGMAVDLGVNYRYSNKWSFSASVLDLGSIRWKTDVAGIRFTETVGDPIDQLEESVSEMADGGLESDVVYTTPLPLKVYLGGQYHLTSQTSLGLLYNARVIQGATDNALSFSFSTFLRNWIGLSLNASAYNRRFFNLGAGLSLNLGPLQVFAVSDNIFGVLGTGRSLDAHAGVNFTFGWHPKETMLKDEEQVAVAPDMNPASVAEEPALQSRKERRAAKKAEKAARAEQNQPAASEEPVVAVAEEPARKPRKERRPPKAKKEKEPDVAAPATPVQPAVQAPPANPNRVTLVANVRDYETDEMAPPVYLDVYKIEPGGGQTIERRDYFPNGAFNLTLERDARYLLDFKVHGYEPLQIEVEPSAEFQEGDSFAKLFFIRKEREQQAEPQPVPPASQPAPETKPQEPARPQPVQEPAAPARPQPATEPAAPPRPQPAAPAPARPAPAPAPENAASQPGVPAAPAAGPETPAQQGIHQLTGRTSLREKATHESAVLQRLAEGQRVEVLEKTNNWWWKVRCDGRLGYVKAQLLQPAGNQ